MFNKISNDSYILNLYNEISYLEDGLKIYCKHGQPHINNVVNIVDNVLTALGYEDSLIEDAKIAATLHDIGCVKGKDGHAERSYRMAKKYLKDNKIKLNNQKMVLEAIRQHSDGFETKNLIASAIIFADKIDLTKNRLNKLGYTISGVRQMGNIKDVAISISDGYLLVKYITNADFSKEEFETFYFIPKVFKAICGFAKNTGLKPLVLLDNIEWLCPIMF